MPSIARETQVEMVIERSRFIALSFRIESPEEGKGKLKEVQGRFPGATHYCYAWRLSENQELASDGGEPKSSAGRPILGTLRHFGLTHALVVVVRYFGGKKLGIRGLIETYGEAARMVLEKSGSAEYHREYLLGITVSLPHWNFLVNRLLQMVKERERMTMEGEGGITLRVPEKEKEAVKAFLTHMQKEGKILHFEEQEGCPCTI